MFSEWCRVPILVFSGGLGIRERRELWLGSSVTKPIQTKNTPDTMEFQYACSSVPAAKMDVVRSDNSSDTCWERSATRISPRIHFSTGTFGFYRLRHAGAQPQLEALPDPPPTRKNQNRDSRPLRKHSQITPGPRLSPLVVKMTKRHFLWDLGPKMVPKWALEAAGWDPRRPSKIGRVKIFSIQVSISSKKPPTPGGWGSQKCTKLESFSSAKLFAQLMS